MPVSATPSKAHQVVFPSRFGLALPFWISILFNALLFLGCGDEGDTIAAPNPGMEASYDGGREEVDGVPQPEAAPLPSCIPKTCAQVGANCGSAPDGCDGVVECGSCPDGQTCGGGGTNLCGTDECYPKTCLQLEVQCGWVSDGCSQAIDCGGCVYPQTCGGAGTLNECGCSPKTCSQLGANCGTLSDGCDGTVVCGSCVSGQRCGGGGPNICGVADCAAKTCSQVGAACGLASDGCSDVLQCGDCEAPDVCGGTGIANECGCPSKTCSQLGASCGTVQTQCGSLDCGDCIGGDSCGGGGVPNQCGCSCSLPNAVTQCVNGLCYLTECLAGFADCDGIADNGCEVDTSSDPIHCGACSNACEVPINATATCESGSCSFVCKTNFGDCDGEPSNGCEVNLSNHPTHCGTCSNACAVPSNATAACKSGSCSFVCKAGFGDCDGKASNGCEVNLNTSVGNCGSCGKTCSFTNAAASCSSGSCKLGTCNSGYANCDKNDTNGCEANLKTSKSHCGSCGRTCSTSCVNGTCEFTSADTARKWDGSYLGSGGAYTYNTQNNYQGQYSESNGVLKSAIGAPDKMFTDLAGAEVLDIWVYLYAAHWYWNSGGVARIGVHGKTTKPSTFPGINQTLEVNFGKPEGKWVRLPTSWYASFKSGAYRGITLHAGNSTNLLYYGYVTANQTKWRWRYRK